MYKAIKELAKITDNVIVGLSLGKDSVCALDLCCKNFKRVSCFFLYMVKDLSFQTTYMEYIRKRYNVEILSIPHWLLGQVYRDKTLTNTLHLDSPVITIKDVENYVREYFNSEYIVTGQMMCESLERNAMIKSVGAVDRKNKRAYPLAEWSPKKVKTYLKEKNIRLAPEYKYQSRSIGDFRTESALTLYNHFREDYYKVIKKFPRVKSYIIRSEFYGK